MGVLYSCCCGGRRRINNNGEENPLLHNRNDVHASVNVTTEQDTGNTINMSESSGSRCSSARSTPDRTRPSATISIRQAIRHAGHQETILYRIRPIEIQAIGVTSVDRLLQGVADVHNRMLHDLRELHDLCTDFDVAFDSEWSERETGDDIGSVFLRVEDVRGNYEFWRDNEGAL